MKTADSRKVGKGLSNRKVLDVLLSLSDAELDKAFLVLGKHGGYDFVSYAGPLEHDLKIGTSPKDYAMLRPAGSFAIVLQDLSVSFTF